MSASFILKFTMQFIHQIEGGIPTQFTNPNFACFQLQIIAVAQHLSLCNGMHESNETLYVTGGKC